MEGLKWTSLGYRRGLIAAGNVGLLDTSYDDFLTSGRRMVDKLIGSASANMTAGLGMLFERQMAAGHWFVAALITWKDGATFRPRQMPITRGGP